MISNIDCYCLVTSADLAWEGQILNTEQYWHSLNEMILSEVWRRNLKKNNRNTLYHTWMFYVLLPERKADMSRTRNSEVSFHGGVTSHCSSIASLPCLIRHWLACAGECAKACGKTATRQLSAAAGLFRLHGRERSLPAARVCGRRSRAGRP